MKRFALGTLIIALSIGYLGAQERGRSLFVDHSDTGETVHVLPSQAAVHSPHDTQPTIAPVKPGLSVYPPSYGSGNLLNGGGPQISDLMRRLGKEPEFVDGRRVTDAETVDIVRMALVGKVNREIVAMVNRLGSYAVGLSGEDAGLIRVDQRDPRLGFVGDVRAIDPTMVTRLLREELIPVIATIGVDDDGQAYNINADTVAGAIAESLDAEKLVYLTDVAGVYENWPDESSLISRVDVDGLERLVANGAVSEGMIPKLESCVSALRNGVHRAHILDGRLPHALLLEFFTREGVGTMVYSS